MKSILEKGILATALVLALSVALALAGCGSEAPAVSTSAPGTTGTTTTSSAGPASSDGQGPQQLQATTVVTDLRIVWEMRFMPDGRLLVTEREGRIVIADVQSGAVTEVGRLDVLARGEGGLLGLALDPDFPATPDVYVSYTYSQGGDDGNRISRLTLSGLEGGAPAIAGETVLVDAIPAGSNHDGSRLAFGPDGYLWVTTGETGQGDLAQRMDSLAGKVLRMTKDGQPAPDNPFLDRPYPFSLIYTLGHRNPQGLAFHPVSNVAYVTEHGPSDNDEVNRLQAAGNYGWPGLHGAAGKPGFVDPIIAWTPTIAPAACLFYVDDLLPQFKGDFLFVTLKQSDLRVLVPTGPDDFTGVAGEQVLFDGEFGRLRALVVGPDGALYLGTSNCDGRGDPREGDDRIIRVAPAGD